MLFRSEKLNQQLEEKIARAEHIATHDELTKIFNRHMFEKTFEIEINRHLRYRHPLSIIFLDIDRFKDFNDQYGHDMGDEILIELANKLKRNIRISDSLARWGGEEFVIITPNTTKEEAYTMAENIRLYIEKSVLVEGVHVTCSFGIASYIGGDNADTLFKRADDALYKAKESGRNKVCVG